ncbi:class I SAM-dependent methyltransferase [Caldimonas thermodepolymerans]|jgi:SAM-dependent methyltransferase|uniref:SAM-dependent methyltransferase n=1 Tax=Caldimonas thermodepolymerans TaxID=215580 RepID=A0A2S5T4I0_9BURK|nr:class I SAM-dependent methyltransferase [Caldimonas thermodepolymerans]PPE69787.1 hypothetical protein C1702_09900 [Caldimonas thermodepolymerans]QPC32621.1 class I SAM-dependent methyltransferase [Caldimonas thermodepolymerans]RDI03371.1 SAM-dependent methyltransferase [Caldimonas thermodepolymerans]TCP06770.1 SAM-dependent methyltransferase [Caldimonas thermodepolymerans]UZG45425.1 class I SAM-dependent methyltransferase [Caldimonas thermodepolymerans]
MQVQHEGGTGREAERMGASLHEEARFHDERIEHDQGERLSYVYASVADVYQFATLSPVEHRGKRVLEVGCFLGDQPRRAPDFQGHYLGIDISPAAIRHCQSLGLPAHFEFRVDDANVLDSVEDGSVDHAFGQGVLHHLELSRFAPALARKLAPGGLARFVEPAQGNALLRLFRRLTPSLRTPGEMPFDRRSIEQLQQHVDVKIRHHALLRPYLPMLFGNHRKVAELARRTDDLLLGHAWLQGQAWLLQVELRPRSG